MGDHADMAREEEEAMQYDPLARSEDMCVFPPPKARGWVRIPIDRLSYWVGVMVGSAATAAVQLLLDMYLGAP